MEEVNCFTLSGSKNLIFRKEGEEYVFFDPIDLEFYVVDEIGAEVLYLISKERKLDCMLDYFKNKYEVSISESKEVILEFLFSFPLFELIYPCLIQSDIYREIHQ